MPSLGLGLGLEIDSGLLSAGAAVADPGEPPSILDIAWYTWRARKISYWEAQAPLARATTYYFADDGNDSTGNGSIGNPYLSILKASQLLSTGVCCLFKKGGTWADPNGINIPDNASVGAYGSGAKPVWKFKQTDLSATWILDTGTTYYSTLATDPAWIKFKDAPYDIGRPLTRATSIVNCRATSDSFFWNTGDTRLYMNIGADPTGTTFEKLAGTTSTTGDVSLGDGARIEGIRLEGYGLHSQAGIITSYGIKTNFSSNGIAVIKNCEVYYSGYHAIGAIGLGKCLIRGCTTGLIRLGPGNDGSNLVAYNDVGSHEFIFHSNTLHSGNLWELGVTRRVTGVYAHIDAITHPTGTIGLAVASQTTYTPGTWSCLNATYLANAFDCGFDIDACRAFIVEETMDYGDDGIIAINVCPSRQAQDRCYYRGFCDNGAGGAGTLGGIGSGWTINSYVIGDRSVGVGYSSLLTATSAADGRFINSRLEYTGYGTLLTRQTNAATWADLKFHNCLLICKNPDSATPINATAPNISNVAGNLVNNAYFASDPVGVDSNAVASGDGLGAIGDSGKSILSAVPARDYVPVASDGLYNEGFYWLQSDHDYNGTLRSTGADIGPISSTHSGTIPTEPVATQLTFGVQPVDTALDEVITPAVTVRALNQYGILDSSFASDVIISIGTGNGSVGGTTTVTSESGVATFDDLTCNKDGTHTLLADSDGLTQAESEEFEILPSFSPGDITGAHAVWLKEEWYTDTGLTTASTGNGDMVKGWKDLSSNSNHLTRSSNAPTRASAGITVGTNIGLDAASNIDISGNFTVYFLGTFTTGKNCCLLGGPSGGDNSYLGHYTDGKFYVLGTTPGTSHDVTNTMNTELCCRVRRVSGVCYIKITGTAEVTLSTNSGFSIKFKRLFQNNVVADETSGFWLKDLIVVSGDISGTSDETDLDAWFTANRGITFSTGP